MRHQYVRASKGVGSIQRTVSLPLLKSVTVPVPPIDLQISLARYLDDADLLIAQALEAKSSLLQGLKMAESATASRLLFDQCAIGSSADNWIGEVPRGWQVLRLKYVASEVVRRSLDGGEQHLSMTQHSGLVPSSEGGGTLLSDSYVGAKLCMTGDIVLNRLKAHLGVFAVAPCDGLVSADYTVLETSPGVLPEYLNAVLRSREFRPELRRSVRGLTEGFWRLYTDDLMVLRVPLPPLEDQVRMMAEVRSATDHLRAAAAAVEREIALLKEYRTRLIADVVTGKLDIRTEAAAQPEVALEEIAETQVADDLELEATHAD